MDYLNLRGEICCPGRDNATFLNETTTDTLDQCEVIGDTGEFDFILVAALFCVSLLHPSKVVQLLTHIRTYLEDLFLFCFTSTWFIGLGIPYAILLHYRIITIIYLKLRYGRLGGLISPMDACSTIQAPNSRLIITSFKVLKGHCGMDHLRKSCEKTISRRNASGNLVYPKFYQTLGRIGGFFCWKPADFDINHHVRLLDETMDSMSESDVFKKLSKIANQDFEPGRANWEILVVPKFRYDNDKENSSEDFTAIIIRIHHAMGDGFSLMKLIMRDVAGETGEIIPEKFQKKRILSRSLFSSLVIFWYLSLKSGRALYRELFHRDNNPLHHGKLSGEKCLLWSRQVDIQSLKDIKNKMATGMSTVLLSAVVGSLRKYIVKKYGEEPKLLSGIIPVPAPNHPDNKMCNKFSIVQMPLPTHSDSFVRCKLIDKEAQLMARSPDAPMNILLMSLVGPLPCWFYSLFFTNKQATVLISNIPGPDRPIKLWEQPLMDTVFWLPSLGVSGVSVSFLSYEDHLRIGLTVDTGVITDGYSGAKEILDGIVQDLTEMGKTIATELNNNKGTDSGYSSDEKTKSVLTSMLAHRKRVQSVLD